MANPSETSTATEAVLGPAGDVQALEAAISAWLTTLESSVRVVRVSEKTLARDFDAQGPGEYEGPDGPTSGKEPDPQAVKAWLARVCRTHGLSCTYEADSRAYAFRRVRRTDG